MRKYYDRHGNEITRFQYEEMRHWEDERISWDWDQKWLARAENGESSIDWGEVGSAVGDIIFVLLGAFVAFIWAIFDLARKS